MSKEKIIAGKTESQWKDLYTNNKLTREDYNTLLHHVFAESCGWVLEYDAFSDNVMLKTGCEGVESGQDNMYLIENCLFCGNPIETITQIKGKTRKEWERLFEDTPFDKTAIKMLLDHVFDGKELGFSKNVWKSYLENTCFALLLDYIMEEV